MDIKLTFGVIFAILIGISVVYPGPERNDKTEKLANKIEPEIAQSEFAISTLIAEKEREKLKYEIVTAVAVHAEILTSTPKPVEVKETLKDGFVRGLAGLILETTFADAEVIQKKDEVKDNIVHDIAGVEISTAITAAKVKVIKDNVKEEIVHDIAGAEFDTAVTVVATKDIEAKVKYELGHNIAGVEFDTAVAVMEAKEVEEEVVETVEKAVDEAGDILEEIWEILQQIWHYLRIVLEVSIPIIALLVIIYIATKLRKYYYLAKRHSGSTPNGNEIPMKALTTTPPTAPVLPNP